MNQEIPRLYETEKIPIPDKIIYQHYLYPPKDGFYWLIAELDPREKLAFGYACLNDPMNAEWGYISIQELEEVGAVLDPDWKPLPFSLALSKVRRYHGEDQ